MDKNIPTPYVWKEVACGAPFDTAADMCCPNCGKRLGPVVVERCPRCGQALLFDKPSAPTCDYCDQKTDPNSGGFYVSNNGIIVCEKCAEKFLKECEYGLYNPTQSSDPDMMYDDELADVEIFKRSPWAKAGK